MRCFLIFGIIKLSKKFLKLYLNVYLVYHEGLNNSQKSTCQKKYTKRDTHKTEILSTCPAGCSTRNEINKCISMQKTEQREKNPVT